MDEWFLVDHLDIERLLSEWKWLCPSEMTLVARTAFGDLFLRDDGGAVFWLNTAVGKLARVADSGREFREMVNHPRNEPSGLRKKKYKLAQNAA
jgi:hypothetical protein